jgi:hypothetical protein
VEFFDGYAHDRQTASLLKNSDLGGNYRDFLKLELLFREISP